MGMTKEIIQSIRMLLRYAILYLYYTYKTMSFVKVCVLHLLPGTYDRNVAISDTQQIWQT
jgi:hypothetical protein